MPKILQALGMAKCIGCYSCMLACARYNYRSYSPKHSAMQVKTQGGIQGRFVADICRACVDAPCVRACPADALVQRRGGGALLVKEKCIGCEQCVPACPVQVVYWDGIQRTPIVCRHCGLCVVYCPHGCLEMAVTS